MDSLHVRVHGSVELPEGTFSNRNNPLENRYLLPAFMFNEDQAAAEPTRREATANFMVVVLI
jgi:hypothetical protein